MNEHQVESINWVRHEAKVQERSLTEELANIQKSVATPPLVELARRVGMQVIYTDNINEEVDENIDPLKTALENVVMDADRLRTTTAERVVGLLNPLQCLKFLSW